MWIDVGSNESSNDTYNLKQATILNVSVRHGSLSKLTYLVPSAMLRVPSIECTSECTTVY